MLHNSDGNCSAIHDGQDDAVKCVKFDTMANNTARESKDTKRARDDFPVVEPNTVNAWNMNLRYPQLYERFRRSLILMDKGLSRLLPIGLTLVIHTTFCRVKNEK